MWVDLDRDRRVGGSRPKQNYYILVILVTHPKSYIKTTDRRDFGGKPSKWRPGEDGCYREKFRNFVARAEPNPKTEFLYFYGTLRLSCSQHTGNSFTPKPMVPMESRDSDGVPFSSLESM